MGKEKLSPEQQAAELSRLQCELNAWAEAMVLAVKERNFGSFAASYLLDGYSLARQIVAAHGHANGADDVLPVIIKGMIPYVNRENYTTIRRALKLLPIAAALQERWGQEEGQITMITSAVITAIEDFRAICLSEDPLNEKLDERITSEQKSFCDIVDQQRKEVNARIAAAQQRDASLKNKKIAVDQKKEILRRIRQKVVAAYWVEKGQKAPMSPTPQSAAASSSSAPATQQAAASVVPTLPQLDSSSAVPHPAAPSSSEPVQQQAVAPKQPNIFIRAAKAIGRAIAYPFVKFGCWFSNLFGNEKKTSAELVLAGPSGNISPAASPVPGERRMSLDEPIEGFRPAVLRNPWGAIPEVAEYPVEKAVNQASTSVSTVIVANS